MYPYAIEADYTLECMLHVFFHIECDERVLTTMLIYLI